MTRAAQRKETAMIQLVVSLGMLLVTSLAAEAAPRSLEGTWTAHDQERRDGRLQFTLRFDGEGDGNMGMGFDRTDFSGLTAGQVDSDARVPVRFEMRREAGTVAFEGAFRGGRGSGDYVFTPDPEYLRALERLGIELEDGGRAADHERLSLVLFDVSTGYIRSMQAIGYRVPLDKYVAFRIFGVDPEYVREMEALGFGKLTADRLIETRVHDVSPAYIRKMRESGNELTLDELVQSRIFQVTPEFEAEMAKAGYRGLEHDQLVQFRIHGVTAEFVREVRALGYDRVPADQLVAMRIHGVTPEFIRRVEKAGYHEVPLDKLIQMRIFDIDPGMIGALDRKN
jgi:hypothetical protein